MAFLSTIQGSFGDEKVAQSTKIGNNPLGVRMVLPDGRVFAHAKMGGTAGVPGKLYVQVAATAGHGNVAASGLITLAAQTIKVGSKSIQITCGATGAIVKDSYADGYMTVQAGTAGIGMVYKVKENTAAAVTVAFTCTLEDSDPIAATIACGTTTVGLRQNEFMNIILRAAASSAVGVIAGVPPIAAASTYYCWVQRRGPCAMKTCATTTVQGGPVVASSAEAGGVIPQLAAATASLALDSAIIGYAENVVTAGEYATIYLTLD